MEKMIGLCWTKPNGKLKMNGGFVKDGRLVVEGLTDEQLEEMKNSSSKHFDVIYLVPSPYRMVNDDGTD